MLLMMNGQLVDEAEAVISVYDHGFMYGVGLFETIRTYGGEPFLLNRHLQRLHDGCREFGITLTYTEDVARREIERLLVANDMTDGYLRISVSAGKAPLGLPVGQYEQPNIVVYVKPVPIAQSFENRPTKTLRLLELRRNIPEGAERRKSFHYMNNILGKREAAAYEQAPDAEGLFLDPNHFVAEGVVSNLFFAKDGVLHTPSLKTGILPGITRAFVIELALQAGIHVEEGCYTIDYLLTADELFVTNSIQELVAVDCLYDLQDARHFFRAGPITAQLAQMYETVRRNTQPLQVMHAAESQLLAKETPHQLICRNLTLPHGERTLIMGILNVTPDSFSDGGLFTDVDRAVKRAKEMVAEGADLIDIGGESTRPGAQRVPLDIELARVIPIVEALIEAVDVPISVDTYKAEVARQALAKGAHIINDVSGLRADREMAAVIAQYSCPIIIMHNREQPDYVNLFEEVQGDLRECIAIAHKAGISDANIWLDPGIGFAKTHEHNLQLMNDLQSITKLGYPVVLGTSRKRFIRNTIDATADDCVEGTAATVAYGIMQGCQIVRVHDIRQMKRVAMMCDAMLRAKK